MEETMSIDRGDMVLGLFLDSMTTNGPNQVVVNEQVEDIMKEDNKQKVVAGFPPPLPQEQCVPPHQRPAQSNQKAKQKQISKGSKGQERRHPRYDPIPVSYAHLLPILVNAGAIMPKQTEPAKFPYSYKHDPHATCGYHAGYVGHSTETCHVLKARVQELIDQKLLSFTPAIVEMPVEKRQSRRRDSESKMSTFTVQIGWLIFHPSSRSFKSSPNSIIPSSIFFISFNLRSSFDSTCTSQLVLQPSSSFVLNPGSAISRCCDQNLQPASIAATDIFFCNAHNQALTRNNHKSIHLREQQHAESYAEKR
ncbi:hypothetical protein KIW84_044053 [Lathyrus oleraceus]|uniref:Uncharacterized protein n=1 Tax=Pisum sativum TaxID=3888 RepID=A0A9D4XJM6_PEA|nr:hypothetical protein KIW84_044053 [Pisum sativum]